VATDSMIRLWILKFEKLFISYATCGGTLTVTHDESAASRLGKNELNVKDIP